MQIRLNSPVRSRDGQNVGTISEVVVNPLSRDVTHVVIRQGLLFAADHVLAVEHVTEAAPNAVSLALNANELEEACVRFDHESFVTVPGTEEDLPQRLWTDPPGVHPSIVPPGVGPSELPPAAVIPTSDTALLADSTVETVDGVVVGHVSQLYTDENDSVTHVVIRRAGVYDEFAALPVEWVAAFEGGAIKLAVEKAVVRQLPDCGDNEK